MDQLSSRSESSRFSRRALGALSGKRAANLAGIPFIALVSWPMIAVLDAGH